MRVLAYKINVKKKREQKQFLWVGFDLEHCGPEAGSPCSPGVVTKLHEGCCASLKPVFFGAITLL